MDSSLFVRELTRLLNRHSVDSRTCIPDFILATAVVGFIDNIGATMSSREMWNGRGRPYEPITALDAPSGKVALRAECEGLRELVKDLLPLAESRAEDLDDILEGSFGGVDRGTADRAWAAVRRAHAATRGEGSENG